MWSHGLETPPDPWLLTFFPIISAVAPVGVTQMHLSHTFPIICVCSYKILFICPFNPGKECFSAQSIFWIINRCCWYNVLKVTQRVVVRKKFSSVPGPRHPFSLASGKRYDPIPRASFQRHSMQLQTCASFPFLFKKIINSSTWYIHLVPYLMYHLGYSLLSFTLVLFKGIPLWICFCLFSQATIDRHLTSS